MTYIITIIIWEALRYLFNRELREFQEDLDSHN
jgi:hypothetical protein